MRGSRFLRKLFAALVAVTTTFALVVGPLPLTAAAAVKPAAEPGWGTVTGIVKDTYGAPITGDFDTDYVINVEVWQWDGADWQHVYADIWGNDFQVDYTTGEFLFDLPEGTYRLRFYDWFNHYSSEGYRDEFYPSGYTVAGAGDVVVSDGGLTTANMTLDLWEHGSAAGVITDATDHSKVGGVYVNAYTKDGFGNWNYDGMGTWGSSSLSLGDWSIEKVPVGQYKLEFTDPEYGLYAPQWYGGGADIDSATSVTIAPSYMSSGLDAEMVRYGHIKGRVIDSGGTGIAGISMVVLESSPEGWMEVSEGSHQHSTDANGYYDYIGLLRVRTASLSGTSRGAISQRHGEGLTVPASTCTVLQTQAPTSLLARARL